MFELSQVRCFVAVAEELHFGRAAQRLNMTQPPLSRQIQLLERAVGCQLLLRSSRSVELTAPGRMFLIDAYRLLRLVESAHISVRDAAQGRTGVIRCGFTAAAALAFMPSLVKHIKSEVPGASIVLKEMVSNRQIEALATGELDLGLIRPPVDRTHNEAICVARESFLVALPDDHPLLAKESLDGKDMAGENLIFYDSSGAPYFYNLVMGYLAKHDVYPAHSHELVQTHSILSFVGAGEGIAIVSESSRQLNVPGVSFRQLSGDAPSAQLYLVWPRNSTNPLVPVLTDMLASIYNLPN